MINIRFHIVSLVAVFLALALGLLVGSTLLDKATVESLRGRLQSIETRLDERTTQLEAAREANESLAAGIDSFGATALEAIVDGELAARHTLIVAPAGIDTSSLETVLANAGARAIGTLRVAAPNLDDAEFDGTMSELSDTLPPDLVHNPVDVDDALPSGGGAETVSTTTSAPSVPSDSSEGEARTPQTDAYGSWLAGMLEVASTPVTERLTLDDAELPAEQIPRSTSVASSIVDERTAVLGLALERLRVSGLATLEAVAEAPEIRAGETLIVVVSGPASDPGADAVVRSAVERLDSGAPGRVVVAEIHASVANPAEQAWGERGSLTAIVAEAGRSSEIATDDELDSPFGLLVTVWCLGDDPAEPGAYGVGASSTQRFPTRGQ